MPNASTHPHFHFSVFAGFSLPFFFLFLSSSFFFLSSGFGLVVWFV